MKIVLIKRGRCGGKERERGGERERKKKKEEEAEEEEEGWEGEKIRKRFINSSSVGWSHWI